MGFLKKYNQLSIKKRIAIIISVLWFLFWVVIGWDGFWGGLAFGGITLIIAWGYWFLSVQSLKDADIMDNRHDTLSDGTAGKREFPRIVYPPTNRPLFKCGDHELKIIDISIKGLRISNERQIDLAKRVHGEAILLSGRSVHVDGEIAWSLNNEVGLLMALIPSSMIDEESRVLSTMRKSK